MKHYTLLGKTYAMSSRSSEFLNQYLIRIERYITKHDIDSGYLGEIQNRIVEKLDDLGDAPQDKDIVSVVNDLGEPEDIFGDIREQESPVTSSPKDENIGFLSRKKKIIFGVALRLSQDLHIPVLYVRLFFLVTLFFFGFGFWAYLILSLLLSGIFFANRKTGEGQSALSVGITRVVRWILNASMIFFGCIAIILGVMAIVGGMSLFGQFIIDGQNIFSEISDSLRILILASALFLVLIGIGLVAFGFKKPIFGRYSWSMLMLLFFLSSAGVFGEGLRIVQGLAESTHVTEKYVFPFSGSTIELVTKNQTTNQQSRPWKLSQGYGIEYIPSSGNDIIVEIDTSLRGRGAQIARTQLAPYLATLSGTELSVLSPDITFNGGGIVPMTVVERRIRIYAPESLMVRQGVMVMGSTRTELENYTPGNYECELSQYIYSTEKHSYICDPLGYSQSIIDTAMRRYAEESVRNDNWSVRSYTGISIASGSYLISVPDWMEDQSQRLVHVSISQNGELFAEVEMSGSTR